MFDTHDEESMTIS